MADQNYRSAKETGQRRESVKERGIDEPVLALDISEQIELLKAEPEWAAGMEDGITLAKYPHMRVVLVSLRKGRSMQEHKIEGPMSLYVISGHISLTAGTSEYELKEKGLLTVRKEVLHEVSAKSDSVFLLTILRAYRGQTEG